MKQSKIIEFKPFEPLKTNRFIIRFLGNENINIPEYLFTGFKMKNIGEDIILKIKLFETTDYTFNPKDLKTITDVKIEFLDPVGTIVHSMILPIKGSNFKKSANYKEDSLLTNKFRFIVDMSKIIIENTKNVIDEGNG
jgi:hypothetical protein